MSTVKGFCVGTYKSGRPCVVRLRDGGDLCSYHRTLARPHYPVSVAAARDEVVRAAQAWAASVDSADRRLCEMRLGTAVAALARLEGK